MRGDLVFYRPRTLLERLICWWTKGQFCHVAVDLGNGQVIAAEQIGIVYAPLGTVAARCSPSPDADIDAGLVWLHAQVGRKYGKLDIADAVLKGLGLSQFFLAERGHYDCSDLAVRYLQHCGEDNPSFEEPHLVTPNDLYKTLKG